MAVTLGKHRLSSFEVCVYIYIYISEGGTKWFDKWLDYSHEAGGSQGKRQIEGVFKASIWTGE